MVGNCNSGRKPKYLTVERFERWVGNDFKHLSWKVNIMLGMWASVLVVLLLERLLK